MEELIIVGLGVVFGILAGWVDHRCTRRLIRHAQKSVIKTKAA